MPKPDAEIICHLDTIWKTIGVVQVALRTDRSTAHRDLAGVETAVLPLSHSISAVGLRAENK
jgi:hypothetical protein